ncbi:unnamed protein product [Symbiodinium natans]|uniref:Uncharacterized protein n=1 Tax=Symbiodinium natans TaxID=878477 RepID=A0A812KSI3_9DINO|nr:unnamed protein product [Symbiodinium natans]
MDSDDRWQPSGGYEGSESQSEIAFPLPRTPKSRRSEFAIEAEYSMSWVLDPPWSLRKPRRRRYRPQADPEFWEPDEDTSHTFVWPQEDDGSVKEEDHSSSSSTTLPSEKEEGEEFLRDTTASEEAAERSAARTPLTLRSSLAAALGTVCSYICGV